LIAAGEGYFMTKSRMGYQIILYHYCHYDRLYCMNQHANIDSKNRYNVFLDRDDIQVKLTLSGLEKGTYRIKQHQLNRDHGSAFDKWVEMGAPEILSPEDINYLTYTSVPKKHISEVRIENDCILNTILQPHEVQLYEILPQRKL
jgi:xylan 1,4-beta-xylosidase